MRLGLFDKDCEYDNIPFEENDTEEHRQLAAEAARRSAVLLKNDGILPLDQSGLKRIAVIGPTADSRKVLEGNYCGTASEYITNLEGIREAAGEGIRIFYSVGCHLFRDRVEPLALPDDRISEAKGCAAASDVIILCLGLDPSIEGEQGDAGNSDAAGDKLNLLLPEPQRVLLSEILSVGKPVILVLNSGSAIDIGDAADRCAAVLQCWYSGAQGGRALGEILFGRCNPSGKLPVTFYRDGTLPDFEDYSMHGRTYRYLNQEPLYPFGYGLSYTSFRFGDLRINQYEAGKPLCGTVTVTNDGNFDGAEVAEFYIKNHIEENAADPRNAKVRGMIGEQPHYSLCGMQRVFLKAGESRMLRFEIQPQSFESVLDDGTRVTMPGRYSFYVGGSQPDSRSVKLTGKEPLCARVQID